MEVEEAGLGRGGAKVFSEELKKLKIMVGSKLEFYENINQN